ITVTSTSCASMRAASVHAGHGATAPDLQPDCKRHGAKGSGKRSYRAMTTNSGWRRLAVCATIDAILIVTIGAAMAAPVAAFSPHVPALMMLGIGMVVSRAGRKHP